MAELNQFRDAAESHHHITAVILPVENYLGG